MILQNSHPPTGQDFWSPEHNGTLTNERAEDVKWAAARCNHEYRPLDKVSVRCEKCGDWHFKNGHR